MKKWISVALAVCLLAVLVGCRKQPQKEYGEMPETQPVVTEPMRQPGEAEMGFSDFDEETSTTTPPATNPKPTIPVATSPTVPDTTQPSQPQETEPTQPQPVYGDDGYYNQVVKP